MTQVEPVDTSTAACAGRVRGVVWQDQSDLFARVLETTRESTQRLSETVNDRAGEAGRARRRHEYLADALADGRREKALTGKPARPRPDGSGRADQLKELQGRSSRGKPEPDQAPEAPDGPSVEDQRPSSPEGAETGKPAAADSQAPQDIAAVDGPTGPGATRSAPTQVSQAAAGRSSGGPTAVASEGAASSPPVGTAGSVITGTSPAPTGDPDGAGAPATGATGSRAPTTGPQGQAAGRDGGSGQPADANQANAAKNSGAAGRSTASAGEFQNVLGAAGRLRTQLTASPSRAAAVVNGGDAGAKGVNLNESRAMTELSQIVRSSIGSRRSTMTLRLQPPELGQLRIDVRMQDQVLTLRLETETVAGRDAIQARLGDLRRALEQHGIQLNQVEVELRPPASPGGGPQTAEHQQPWMHDGSDAGQDANSGSPQADSETGAGRDLPGARSEADETMTTPGAQDTPEDDGYDPVERLAETGIDLVV